MIEAVIYCGLLALMSLCVGNLFNTLIRASAYTSSYEQVFRAWSIFAEDGLRAPCARAAWQKNEKKCCSWLSGGVSITWEWEERNGHARLIRTIGRHQELVFLGRRAGEFVYEGADGIIMRIGLTLPLHNGGLQDTFYVACCEGRVII